METKDIKPMDIMAGLPALQNNKLMPMPTGNFFTDLFGGWRQAVVNTRLKRAVDASELLAQYLKVPLELQAYQAELQHNNNMFALQEAEQLHKNKALEHEANMLRLQVELQSYQNRQQMGDDEDPEDLINKLKELLNKK